MKYEPLKCDLCNGNLIMDDSREFAVCEFCGTRYMKNTLQAKIQEIKGTVEVVRGNSQKQIMLDRAHIHTKRNDYLNALLTYHEIMNEFPDEIVAYQKTFDIMVDTGLYLDYDKFSKEYRLSGASFHYAFDKLFNMYLKLFNHSSDLSYYRNTFWKNILTNKILPDIPKLKEHLLYDVKIVETGLKNAEAINTWNLTNDIMLRNLGSLSESRKKDILHNCHYECDFCYGRVFKFSKYVSAGNDDPEGNRYLFLNSNVPINNLLSELINERKRQNLCIHCGGFFRGLIKKCSKCGAPKDY